MKKTLKPVKIALIIIGSLMLDCLIVIGSLYLIAYIMLSQDEFPEPDYPELLSAYQTTLGIYLPTRTPDFCTDTHGGNGDGDTIIIIHLDDEEAERISNDISTNGYWKQFPLDDLLSGYLYGADYCDKEKSGTVFIDGLLDQKIERLSNGYYCFYNKQTNNRDMPDYGADSYNFIFVEYDTVNKTIWLSG